MKALKCLICGHIQTTNALICEKCGSIVFTNNN